ncbi:MAG TPA: HAD-IA family hydrolase [Burkholderiaceae bacterium]|nr:HAD-IA family hydrolase [Burkholderiaceae bacterium]
MTRFAAVLFDCDGVLVDSEPITNGVLREMLAEMGWSMSVQECSGHFVGHAVIDQAHLIQANTGQQVTPQWLASFRARRDEALLTRLEAVQGIHACVDTVSAAMAGRIAVASGADIGKVHLQLNKVGLISAFAGRSFSGMEQARNKPHPDVYWAAAHALGVPIAQCAVIEDSPNGASAGLAAGATVFGFVPKEESVASFYAGKSALQEVGVQHFFAHMNELPALLGC